MYFIQEKLFAYQEFHERLATKSNLNSSTHWALNVCAQDHYPGMNPKTEHIIVITQINKSTMCFEVDRLAPSRAPGVSVLKQIHWDSI